jgi:hypothetical protein
MAHLDWPTVPRRQLLLFPTSACNKLTPPLRRAPPGPQAGSSLAPDAPLKHALILGVTPNPSSDATINPFDASAVVQPCSSSRCAPDPLRASLFRSRSPPRLLTDMTLRRFEPSACTASPGGLPHHWYGTVCVADLLHRRHIPFKTHGVLESAVTRTVVRGGWQPPRLPSLAVIGGTTFRRRRPEEGRHYGAPCKCRYRVVELNARLAAICPRSLGTGTLARRLATGEAGRSGCCPRGGSCGVRQRGGGRQTGATTTPATRPGRRADVLTSPRSRPADVQPGRRCRRRRAATALVPALVPGRSSRAPVLGPHGGRRS